jgi:hypothetical protein
MVTAGFRRKYTRTLQQRNRTGRNFTQSYNPADFDISYQKQTQHAKVTNADEDKQYSDDEELRDSRSDRNTSKKGKKRKSTTISKVKSKNRMNPISCCGLV